MKPYCRASSRYDRLSPISCRSEAPNAARTTAALSFSGTIVRGTPPKKRNASTWRRNQILVDWSKTMRAKRSAKSEDHQEDPGLAYFAGLGVEELAEKGEVDLGHLAGRRAPSRTPVPMWMVGASVLERGVLTAVLGARLEQLSPGMRAEVSALSSGSLLHLDAIAL